MQTFKYKISLDAYVSRNPNSGYGKITASTFNLNVMLTQDIKDIGRFIDEPFIPFDENGITLDYQPLPQKLAGINALDFNFITAPGSNFYTTGYNYDGVRYKYKTISDYYTNNIIVSGLTEDRLESFTAYGFTGNTRFIPSFDIEKNQYINYLNNTINGVSRVISLNDLNPIIYTEDANLNDSNFGTILQGDGILFKTYVDEDKTEMFYHGQGVNSINSSLSALTIEEYLLHITERPKVESDIFIDRGVTSVLQSHFQLGEITSMGDLLNYGNGYYNIVK